MKLGFFMSTVWVSLLCSTQAKDSPSPAVSSIVTPKILVATSRIPLDIPPFVSMGYTICDADGDMFFNVGTGPGQLGPFLGINHDLARHTVFDLPRDESGPGVVNWAVSPDGTFYALHSDYKNQSYRLIRYKEDGGVDRVIDESIPSGTDVQHLAVSNSGVTYVAGYSKNKEGDKSARRGFSALFTGSGKLIRDLSQKSPTERLDLKHPEEGDVKAASDDRFYILRENGVEVLNQLGEQEKQIPLNKPAKGSYPARIDYSEGVLSVGFETVRNVPGRASILDIRMILVDAQTGEELGDYSFDPGLTGNVLCFSRRAGFTMWARGPDQIVEFVPIR